MLFLFHVCRFESLLVVTLQNEALSDTCPIPEFDVLHLRLISAGSSEYGNFEAREISLDQWTKMEGFLNGSPSTNWLDSSNKSSISRHTACVGEEIGIDIEVCNPSKINLDVSDLRLICSTDLEEDSSTVDTVQGVTCLREKVTLYPGERAMVNLKCKPLEIGRLTIQGIAWILQGSVTGKKLLRPEKSKWALDDNSKKFGGPITLEVMPPMPRLLVKAVDLPGDLYVGEIVKCKFKVRNIGATPLHNIVAISSPFLYLEGAKFETRDEQKSSYQKFKLNDVKLDVEEEFDVSGFLRYVSYL